MKFKRSDNYAATAVAEPGPDDELAAAEAARAEAQSELDSLRAKLKAAEGEFEIAKAAHLAAVSRRMGSAPEVDLAATRARMGDNEDAVAALKWQVSEALQRLRAADLRYQPVAAAAEQRHIEREQAQLAAEFRAALAEAREQYALAAAAVDRMQRASDALLREPHLERGGRQLATALRRESDGLPVVTGRLALGQLGGVKRFA